MEIRNAYKTDFGTSPYNQLINRLRIQGGPECRDYPDLDHWVIDLKRSISAGRMREGEIDSIRCSFGDALSLETMQGFSLLKPHGYAGDFEIIDRIYQGYESDRPHLARWDRYFHQHAAPKAVRNRKVYFHRLLDQLVHRHPSPKVLKIAVGPGRSMFEWLERNPNSRIHFDCLEIDPKAIRFATRLNANHLDRIRISQGNALRFVPEDKYDLIWIAGLLDYFKDRTFVRLLRGLHTALNPNGEMVIGNFSNRNPSRAYMELIGGWDLHHRSEQQLSDLATRAGIPGDDVRVDMEPEQVNLFLRILRQTV